MLCLKEGEIKNHFPNRNLYNRGMKDNEKDFAHLCLNPIAYIHTDFPTKFGIPRQGTVVPSLKGRIVLEKEYRKEGVYRGIENYSHLWLIWGFSDSSKKEFSPTVRPPKMGGNERVGVFASRSPYRPNPLGLTVVKLEEVVQDKKDGPVLIVTGADLMDHTPIYDIKPYLPYADCIPEAKNGLGTPIEKVHLKVEIPETFLSQIPEDKVEPLKDVLSQDPRPGYEKDSDRVYSFEFSHLRIRFKVESSTVYVVSIEPYQEEKE